MGFGWKNLCTEISTEKCILTIQYYQIRINALVWPQLWPCISPSVFVGFTRGLMRLNARIVKFLMDCTMCSPSTSLKIHKPAWEPNVPNSHQLFVNAQNCDFSNRNRVGAGPISTYETHTQSHITICLIRCKISSVSYKNKQADPGCPDVQVDKNRGHHDGDQKDGGNR